MKKSIIILIALAVLASFTGCGSKKASDIPEEVMTFGGPDFQEAFLDTDKASEVKLQIGGEQAREVTLTEKANISETIRVFRELQKYKKNDYKCEAQDVKIQIKLSTGETDYWIFKGIRPVEDYFINIFNSLEYKRKSLPIFNVKKEDIKKVKFEASKKEYVTELAEKEIIDKAFENAIKHYETVNYYGEQNFYGSGCVYFYDNKGNELARGLILRSDTQWNELYGKYEAIRKIKINPEDISRITITDDRAGKEIVISEKNLKQKVLDTYYDGATSQSIITVRLDFAIKNTSNASLYGSYRKGEIPDFLIELLK